jgi:tetratricopeptide (TPR) repeat protein
MARTALKRIRRTLHTKRTEVVAISLCIILISFLYTWTEIRDRYASSIFASNISDTTLRLLYIDRLGDPGLYFALGNRYFSSGAQYNIAKAEKYYTAALRLDTKYPLANYQLARVYFVSNKQSAALTYIDRELLYYPDNKRSYYIRGLINGYSDNLRAAVRDFTMFLEWKPESWAGHNDLAWVYFRQGDYNNAYEIAAGGLKYSPNNPWLLNSVGVALQNLGDATAAKKAYSASLSHIDTLTPDSWGKAYPGNDPGFYKLGYSNMRQTVEENIARLDTSL